ncbi:MAG: trypsin-like peptidase domain-containing protein [Pseudomonas helleri]|uniref:RNA-directed DNA polymerase n=1 Tax=Pseudomonas helleri TaxID=1608996 RepID=A0A7X1Y9F8_9PSED|nr:trypsin-like peptidase domain-containing protein [Pseudomonas helleri]MQT75705.1 trypsin-like serine protease [Pseudomonas helleri]MQT96674.1 trypsin-like serine protease [Pseudomonas helleri]MQU31890.1 trypsin-like serine protease [Pseudomonas helleri]
MKLDSTLSVDGLASLLGTSYIKIKHFYYKPNTSAYYSTFEIDKKSGGKRKIMSPEERLKTLQRRLKLLLEGVYVSKKQVNAFVKDRSIVTNAKSHTRKKFVLNIDLEDFFTTITFARIRGLLIAKPYALQSSVATVIAHLATVHGFLPQGSPCSPILSNMVCSSMDRQLLSLAKAHRAEYSRYADDISFSFYDNLQFISEDIVETVKSDGLHNHYQCQTGQALESIILRSGFKINESKVRLQGRYERQVVTGLVVNKKVNVDRQYIRKTSAMIHSISTDGLTLAREKFKSKVKDSSVMLDAHLQGRLLFIKQVVTVDSVVYKRLAKKFNLLEIDYKVPLGKSKSVRGLESRRYSKWYDERCWVIESELSTAEEFDCSQGTGFAIKGGYIITCAHVVKLKGGIANDISLCRVSKRGEVYKASVIVCDDNRDLAVLKIVEPALAILPYFDMSETIADIGDGVDILGFPNDKLGATHVGRQKVSVRNKFAISAVTFCQIDKELYSGNSGGPALNDDGDLIGVVTSGNDGGGFNDHSRFVCISELKKVLQDLVVAANEQALA